MVKYKKGFGFIAPDDGGKDADGHKPGTERKDQPCRDWKRLWKAGQQQTAPTFYRTVVVACVLNSAGDD
jgi:hypothetical protein